MSTSRPVRSNHSWICSKVQCRVCILQGLPSIVCTRGRLSWWWKISILPFGLMTRLASINKFSRAERWSKTNEQRIRSYDSSCKGKMSNRSACTRDTHAGVRDNNFSEISRIVRECTPADVYIFARLPSHPPKSSTSSPCKVLGKYFSKNGLSRADSLLWYDWYWVSKQSYPSWGLSTEICWCVYPKPIL